MAVVFRALFGFCLLCLLLALPFRGVAQPIPLPLTDADYAPVREDVARLGQLLFYDPILSGNRSVACSSCHHPAFGTGDGVSLSFGDGGIGIGPGRVADPDNWPEKRIPRNAPALFNLGAFEFQVLFHDGRLEADPSKPGGIRTPMGGDMAVGFASLLSAQTMFPVLSRDEMAGSHRENEVAKRVRQGIITGPGGAWDVLARRVAGVPDYVAAFRAAYPHIQGPDDIAFTDISNAIADFMAFEWRSDTAPFDAYLRGDTALLPAQQRGLDLFYGAAGCAGCHSGPFLTDHAFHAMAVPQLGPGKAATFENHTRDDGRFRVTGREEDRFAFRTPSLRNVTLTAPYGHTGSHGDLAAFVADHADPVAALARYDRRQAILPAYDAKDFSQLMDPAAQAALVHAVTADPVMLSTAEVADLVAFLGALTDPAAIDGRLGIPASVPSGLPIPALADP